MKTFLKSEKVQNLILIGLLIGLYVYNSEEKSSEENAETFRLFSFVIVVMLSFAYTNKKLVSFYRRRLNLENQEKQTPTNNFSAILGFAAVIVLLLITDFSELTFLSIGMGIFWGAIQSLFWLAGQGGMKIWDFLKKKQRKKMFDYFSNRPENLKRKEGKNND